MSTAEQISYIESLGFKNLSRREEYPKFIFEYYDLASKSHFIVALYDLNKIWYLSDGRPTVDIVFHKGEMPIDSKLVSLMLQHAGNLKREPIASQSR